MGREEVLAPLDLEGTWREDLVMRREGEGTGREEQGMALEEPFG